MVSERVQEPAEPPLVALFRPAATITPAKVKASHSDPKKSPRKATSVEPAGGSSKAEAVAKKSRRRLRVHRQRQGETEAETKNKAESAARLEAKKKVEAEERRQKDLEARRQSGERPLIALDWHKTLSFDNTGEEKATECLSERLSCSERSRIGVLTCALSALLPAQIHSVKFFNVPRSLKWS